jgi:hypothetical protein
MFLCDVSQCHLSSGLIAPNVKRWSPYVVNSSFFVQNKEYDPFHPFDLCSGLPNTIVREASNPEGFDDSCITMIQVPMNSQRFSQ